MSDPASAEASTPSPADAPEAQPTEADSLVEGEAAQDPDPAADEGPEEDSYTLQVFLVRGDPDSDDSMEVAGDAWQFDATGDDEASVLAVDTLMTEYGGEDDAEGQGLPGEGQQGPQGPPQGQPQPPGPPPGPQAPGPGPGQQPPPGQAPPQPMS